MAIAAKLFIVIVQYCANVVCQNMRLTVSGSIDNVFSVRLICCVALADVFFCCDIDKVEWNNDNVTIDSRPST